MADNNEAIVGRIHDQDEGNTKRLSTPSAVCRLRDLPKVDQKQGALRPPRTAKVLMPFLDDMTDEAMAAFRKRMEAEQAEVLAERASTMTPRTA